VPQHQYGQNRPENGVLRGEIERLDKTLAKPDRLFAERSVLPGIVERAANPEILITVQEPSGSEDQQGRYGESCCRADGLEFEKGREKQNLRQVVLPINVHAPPKISEARRQEPQMVCLGQLEAEHVQ